jgi:hypothetical protein
MSNSAVKLDEFILFKPFEMFKVTDKAIARTGYRAIATLA